MSTGRSVAARLVVWAHLASWVSLAYGTVWYVLPRSVSGRQIRYWWSAGVARLIPSEQVVAALPVVLSVVSVVVCLSAVALALRARLGHREPQYYRHIALISAALVALQLPRWSRLFVPLLPEWVDPTFFLSAGVTLTLSIIGLSCGVRAKLHRRATGAKPWLLGREDTATAVALLVFFSTSVLGTNEFRGWRMRRLAILSDIITNLDGLLLEDYRRVNGRFPLPCNLAPATALAEAFQGSKPSFRYTDPWGRPLLYACSCDGLHYRLVSLGPDGTLDSRAAFDGCETEDRSETWRLASDGTAPRADAVHGECGFIRRITWFDLGFVDDPRTHSDARLRTEIDAAQRVVAQWAPAGP